MAHKRLRLALGAFLLVATVAPIPAASAGTYSGTWSGKTGQKEAIKFKVNKNDVVTFVKVTYEIPACGVTATTWLRDLSEKIKNGKFTAKYESSTGDVTVKGTMVSAGKASGSLKATFNSGCYGSMKTNWSAHK